jgi:hypothetical protein
MSLDVSLRRKIYIRYDNELSVELKEEIVYDANITHNLAEMAEEAGIYVALWRPHRLNGNYNIPEDDHNAEYEFEINNPTYAKDIIELLENGLNELKTRPTHYEKFNSENGWGCYKYFVPFVQNYLNACKEYPNTKVHTCR